MASKRKSIDVSRDENQVRLFLSGFSSRLMDKQGRPRRSCAGKVDLRSIPRYRKGNDARAEAQRQVWGEKKAWELHSR